MPFWVFLHSLMMKDVKGTLKGPFVGYLSNHSWENCASSWILSRMWRALIRYKNRHQHGLIDGVLQFCFIIGGGFVAIAMNTDYLPLFFGFFGGIKIWTCRGCCTVMRVDTRRSPSLGLVRFNLLQKLEIYAAVLVESGGAAGIIGDICAVSW